MRPALVAALALLGLTLAAPAPQSNSLVKRSFKAPAPPRTRKNPYDDINRTCQKWGWSIIVVDNSAFVGSSSISDAAPALVTTTFTMAPGLTTASSLPTYNNGTSAGHTAPTVTATYPSTTGGTEDGEATTTPEENESEYLTPVNVGGQLLNLNFDTGSADLWVFSSKLPDSQVQGQSVFNPSKSNTWQELRGATWNITYGDGSGAGGIVGYDVVDIGGSTVEKQAVELATHVSLGMIRDPNSDGLLGLAFSNINTVKPQPQKTFFENLMNDLSQPLFTADLTETDGKGTYEFGQIDTSKYSGDIHYAPVDSSEGFWSFNVSSYKIGDGGGPEVKCKQCAPVIADTGTSLVYLEKSIVDAYYSSVQGVDQEDGVLAAPCDSDLPDLGISIEGWFATLKGKDMFYMKSPYPGRENMCWGGLQPSPTTEVSILGDVFLKQFFAVFDGGEMRFGVAEKD